MKRTCLAGVLLGVMLATIWQVSRVNAQNRSNAPANQQPQAKPGCPTCGRQVKVVPPRERSHEERFWEWMQVVKYQNWAPWTGQNGDFYEGKHPHGDLLKIYANRTALSDPEKLPDGSILILENYDADKKLSAVSVMWRSKGYDVANGDWWYARYNGDGTIDRRGEDKLVGKVRACMQCHASAKGQDHVYCNDVE